MKHLFTLSCFTLLCVFATEVMAGDIPDFNAKKAWNYLVTQTDFGPRNPGSDGHYLAEDYLVGTLKQYADSVREQSFDYTYPYGDSGYRFTNIIADFGDDSGKRILLGAHWDTRPWADNSRDYSDWKTPIPGANDGASGVAVLLELARIFHDSPPSQAVTIVLFDAEDMGKTQYIEQYSVGSRYYAKHLKDPNRFDYAVVLDMIGDANLQLSMEQNSLRSAPDITRHIWTLGKKLGYSAFVQQPGQEIYDDHLQLIKYAGIPAVDLIDFAYPDQSNAYWHTLDDIPSHCSPESLDIIGTVLLHLIYGDSE